MTKLPTRTGAGAAPVVARLARLARDLDAPLVAALAAAGETLAADAVWRAPVATGRLRAAIGARLDTSADAPTVVVGVIEPALDYAAAVEFGTAGPRGSAPRPFLRPAFDAARQRLPAALARAVVAAIRRVAGVRVP